MCISSMYFTFLFNNGVTSFDFSNPITERNPKFSDSFGTFFSGCFQLKRGSTIKISTEDVGLIDVTVQNFTVNYDQYKA